MNTKQKWYLSTWFIALLCACWFLIIPPIIGIILLIIKAVNDKKQKELFTQTFNQNNQLSQEYSEMKQTCDELGVTEYIETKKKIEQIEQESAAKIASSESEAKANLDSLNEEIQSNNVLIDKLRTEINELQQQDDKLKKSLATQPRQAVPCLFRALYMSQQMNHIIQKIYVLYHLLQSLFHFLKALLRLLYVNLMDLS